MAWAILGDNLKFSTSNSAAGASPQLLAARL